MPLQKVQFRSGVNREGTRYTTEGGWYDGDKIRFRQGTPECIGGWYPLSLNTFYGVCRSLWSWVTNSGQSLLGLGTNLKFYIEQGSAYYDVTPIRSTATLGSNPFTGNGTTTVTVAHTAHGAVNGDFVTYSGVTGTYASALNAEYQITYVDANSYTITTASVVAAGATGGAAVSATYQINTGAVYAVPFVGWGSGLWSSGTWGRDASSIRPLRLWSQSNYGEDLIFAPYSGPLYYWDATGGVATRAAALNTLGGAVTFTSASPTVVTLTNVLSEGTQVQFATTGSLPTGVSAATTYTIYNVDGLTCNLLDGSGNVVNTSSTGSNCYISLLVDVPTVQCFVLVSDIGRFVLSFGCNDYGSATQNSMLFRWSASGNPLAWTPDPTNQAGSLQLSHGSDIIAAVQTRQEIVAITDSSVYSIQYQGPPTVWGAQLLSDSISIMGLNSATLASGVVYWMGTDKFYAYDGRVQTLNCDVRKYVFSDINMLQRTQFVCGTNEGFNEVWWHYCSADSNLIDRYVVYNYLENVWYYGTLDRFAWLDSGLRQYPIASTYDEATQLGRLVNHEYGINDNTDGTDYALNAFISSSEFDIGDGHNFGFVWRMLPDLTFNNSTDSPEQLSPRVTMTLYGLANSGSGVADTASATVAKGSTYVITEEYTGEVFTRLRGRQMILRVESDQVNTSWQLGAPRIDARPDGRR